MQSEKDIKEYLTDIFGGDTPALCEFQQEFLLRWHPPERPPSIPSVEEQQLLEPLVRPRQEEMVLFADRKGEGGGRGGGGGGKGKDKKKVCCDFRTLRARWKKASEGEGVSPDKTILLVDSNQVFKSKNQACLFFQPRQDTLVVHILVSHSQVHLNETGNEAGTYTGWDFCTVTIYITGSILLDAALLCDTGGQW